MPVDTNHDGSLTPKKTKEKTAEKSLKTLPTRRKIKKLRSTFMTLTIVYPAIDAFPPFLLMTLEIYTSR